MHQYTKYIKVYKFTMILKAIQNKQTAPPKLIDSLWRLLKNQIMILKIDN